MRNFLMLLALTACGAHHAVSKEHIDHSELKPIEALIDHSEVKPIDALIDHSELKPIEALIDHSKVKPIEALIDPIDGALTPPRQPRIINGNAASREDLPYQAALYLDNSFFCGGSLISVQWVLTAAHCASSTTTFTVHLGAVQLNEIENGRVLVESRSKVVHSSYNPLNFYNDIALLNLSRPVYVTIFVRPISLASGSLTYAGVVGRVSGWGKTSDSGGVSNQLYYVDLSVITNSVCQRTYGNTIFSSTICAQGGSGRSTCIGDNGGPLVDLSSGEQIGIVSFGSTRGCSLGYAVGFTRVTSFRSWITANSGV